MMTTDEAIKIMEAEEASDFAGITYDYEEAARLGIEALKRLQQNRTLHFIPSLKLLPGETEGRQNEHIESYRNQH